MRSFLHRFAAWRAALLSLALGVAVIAAAGSPPEPAGSVVAPPASQRAAERSAPAQNALPALPFLVVTVSPERPLTEVDAARYREIFALQRGADWTGADRLITQLADGGDALLRGHVLAQRYLHRSGYRARYTELAGWLARYADHPDAAAIHRLALKRKPAGAAAPPRPVAREDSLAAAEPLDLVYPYRSKKRLSLAERKQVQRLKRRIRSNLRRFVLTGTERLLEQKEVRRLFDRFELDDSYAETAAVWLYTGKPGKALRLADAVAGRSGDLIPTAYWTAGLAAWRLGRIATAARHFEQLAASENASTWNRSAGAYWAARAHEKLADAAEAQAWQQRAAAYPSTFYGLLATRRLGRDPDTRFQAPPLNAERMGRLMAAPEGKRAMALIQVGETQRAEHELMMLANWRDPETARSILALTHEADLPRLGGRISQRLLSDGGFGWSAEDLGATLYPLPPWQPQGGFGLDRALIYAFMRQESGFDPRARSPDGARGLMQLMPRTARALDKNNEFRGHERDLLFDPHLNMTLGQRYLTQLLDSRRVDRDVLRLAVAYNAGPGNLGKWDRRMKYDGDPLLFIESLPTLETRLFAERVLTNLWIYRLRLGQATPTLDALAADRWPAYEALDDGATTAQATAAR